jgi:hypothetical protein
LKPGLETGFEKNGPALISWAFLLNLKNHAQDLDIKKCAKSVLAHFYD